MMPLVPCIVAFFWHINFCSFLSCFHGHGDFDRLYFSFNHFYWCLWFYFIPFFLDGGICMVFFHFVLSGWRTMYVYVCVVECFFLSSMQYFYCLGWIGDTNLCIHSTPVGGVFFSSFNTNTNERRFNFSSLLCHMDM